MSLLLKLLALSVTCQGMAVTLEDFKNYSLLEKAEKIQKNVNPSTNKTLNLA